MTDAEILQIYMDLSENVRALATARDGVLRDINLQIRRRDDFQVALRTKLLAVLYSGWSEAQFLQIAHTPHAFRYSEIEAIKAEKDQRGIEQAWRYMLAEAVQRVGDVSLKKDLADRLATLLDLVTEYVGSPAQLRNKLAHGQWVIAYNRAYTARNDDFTQLIADLDPVHIERQFKAHEYMGYILRDLVQSPKKGFHRHYWTNIVNLEQYLRKTRGWTISTKRERLLAKPIVRGGHRSGKGAT